MKLTKRQKKLLKLAILNLDNVNGIIGIENYTEGLTYDKAEQDLSCLADDLRIEFDIED